MEPFSFLLMEQTALSILCVYFLVYYDLGLQIFVSVFIALFQILIKAFPHLKDLSSSLVLSLTFSFVLFPQFIA